MRGKIDGLYYDYTDGHPKLQISLDEEERSETLELLQKMIGKDLSIVINEYKEQRSTKANALFWKCIGDMAKALNVSKDEVYYKMLKRYGKYTYIVVKKEAVGKIKETWKACEEVGKIIVNGCEAVQLLCYYKTSQYDTKEFAYLLEGTLSEMREMGLRSASYDEISDGHQTHVN